MREALFSAIESWCGSLAGLRFLDLYAGSGAVGLEAWSRGAGVVTLVEQDRRTAAMICGERPRPRLQHGRRRDAARSPARSRRPPTAPYDVVVPRPAVRPRRATTLAADLAALVDQGWLVPGAMVVVERGTRGPEPAWPDGFGASREKKYGETVLWYVHAAASSTA